ncbi:dethiobiotin synthetase/malonyl-CoA O-methyltransferase [Fodinibius salinus]|uniref:ATP-dependent dethiobiotin synthetase BioD n=1 Tax=Fodinibius salinus TaxID=860790 RepID=A0A5D3YMV3_9BACT|nr:dethiobiotin synthase [Fodinibius salinus]TYP95117.1 dethiobiotin synthetase/malonyl-CoA O-methyltransferase [Fodinibius salinus]
MDLKDWPSHIFVTGTDTGIGKTVVSAMLTKALNASYWKPIQAGLEEETDTEFVRRTTGFSEDRIIPERYRLETPMSPHGAAKIDDVYIEMSDFSLPKYDTDHLVVEGAGGLMVPINDEDMIIDLISYLQLPVVLVARSSLGTLNHTFLSLEALWRRDIPILGVVMNGPEHQSNREAIQHYGNIDILAEIDTMQDINPNALQATFEKSFL